jgi:hypothetical protein
LKERRASAALFFALACYWVYRARNFFLRAAKPLAHRWGHQLIDKHVSSPEFFQQKRRVFSSKWKYLPPALGKNFRHPAVFAGPNSG